ncbi:MAG: sulfite exporter TauE/SafE family protein [Candidatus Contendobacter sp.]
MLLLSLAFGCMIGFVLGLTGGGGGIFAVPLLVYGLGVPTHQAIVISLATVGLTALSGGLLLLPGGEAEGRTALIFGLSGILGAPLGAWVNPYLPATGLLSGFALLMLVVAWHLWRQATQRPEESRIMFGASDPALDESAGPACRYDPGGRLQFTSRCALRLALTGSATGLLSGLFGVGGGFLIVPALVLVAALPIRRAVATSLWVIAIISSIALLTHLLAGHRLDFGLTAGFVLGGLGGMGFGIALGRRIAGPQLQKTFASMVAIVAVFIMARLVIDR